MYERFLDCGYTPQQFYRLSIKEAIDLINSYNRQKEMRLKEEYQKLISTLDLFGSNLLEKIILTFGQNEQAEEVKFSLLEYFPELFQNQTGGKIKEKVGESSETDKMSGLSPGMQVYKAKRLQHTFRVNKDRERRGLNHG